MAASTYLSLDDASAHLKVSRRQLSASVAALNLKTTRIDRRSYLATADVERIQAMRSGEESKTNPIYSGSITYSNSPQPQQMPRAYKNFAKEAYANDPTFFKAANYVITNGAAIPPKLYTDATLQTEIERHPLLDKLEQPNAEQSGVDYREAIIGWLLIAGNAFEYASRATRKNGPPDELWVLPTPMVHPVTMKPRGVTGYKFDALEDQAPPIPPEQICHHKFFNPSDDVFGLSPVEPAALLLDQNRSARLWNLALLQNYARMPGAWTIPTALAKNERDKLEQNLKNKLQGYANAGTPPVLDAGLTWQSLAVAPTDMDWLESIRRNEGGIANVINIPPPLIGDTSASTYNNMGEAKAASYTEEIFPVLDRLYAGWRRWLQPMYGLKGAYLYYDKESVEVVQQVIQAQKNAQADRAVKAYLAGLITLDQANVLMGLPELPDGQGKVYRIGLVLVPAESMMVYALQSLSTPATAPMPQPEPLDVPATQPDANTAPPGGNANNAPAQEPTKEPPASQPEPKPPTKRQAPTLAAKAKAKRLRRQGKAASGDVTHLLWECMPGACEFCSENDGEVRAEGEEFPNGTTSPEDCHKFCRCEATELSIPDDVNPEDYHPDALAYFFGVGFIASRHDRDVAAQQAQEDDEDEGDDDEEYAKMTRIDAARERKQRKEAYRQFMQEALP